MKKLSCLLVVFLLSFTAVTGCATSPPKTVPVANVTKATNLPLPAVTQLAQTDSKTAAKVIAAAQPVANAKYLTEGDVKFMDNYQDKFKPLNGVCAAKWWRGVQAQIVCYNNERQGTIPPTLKDEMIRYLSSTGQNGADPDPENPHYKLFYFNQLPVPAPEKSFIKTPAAQETVTEEKKTAAAVAPAVKEKAAVAAPAQTAASATNDAELAKLKADLAALKATEAKRLAAEKAEADRKAREAEEAAKAKAEKARKAAAAARAAAEAKQTEACLDGLKRLGFEGNEGIKNFQKKYALIQDGVAGPVTCKQMRAVLTACLDCDEEPAAEPAKTK